MFDPDDPTCVCYLVAATAARTTRSPVPEHLPTRRPRRYPSDTSDVEWQIIAVRAGRRHDQRDGRPVTYPRRDIVDAIRYLDHNGCVWRALPVDFPPWPTVYHYFRAWTRDGTLTRMHHACANRSARRRPPNAEPTAAIIDSQSVRAAETVAANQPRLRRRQEGQRPQTPHRRRHRGLLLVVLVTAAGVQDRDAARTLLGRCAPAFPASAWSGPTPATPASSSTGPATTSSLTVQIVRKLAGQIGFTVLPRSWVVERTLSWINRCRRTVRDYERQPEHHAAMVQWAMVIIMTRRLVARYRTTSRSPTTQTT